MRIKIPLVGGSYKHDSLPFDAQETINMFPERGGAMSKSSAIFRRMPGLKYKTQITIGEGPIRGLYTASNGRLFTARYDQMLEMNTTLDGWTVLGSISESTDTITMTDNGTQLVIADGSDMWVYVFATAAFAKVTDASGLAPTATPVLDFADGYVFGFDDGEALGTFRHSELNDANTWNVLDVYTAEGSPDKLVSLKVLNRQVWLFGSQSFEVYSDRGGNNVTSPTWARIIGTFKNIGCAAKYSPAVIRGQIFWLGASKEGENIVWMSGGDYQPIQISTKAMETTIAGYSTTSDAIGYTLSYLGHFFYVLTFPTGDKTFVYDLTEGEWINWASRDNRSGIQQRHRAVHQAFFNGVNIVGDISNGNIYELSKTTYTDDSQPIVLERYFPHFQVDKKRVSWYSIEIDYLVGSALREYGDAPQIRIRWSDDGGYTYSNFHLMSLGKTGKYSTRVIKRLLGQSRDRVFHIQCSEPIDMSIQDNTYAEIEVSDS